MPENGKIQNIVKIVRDFFQISLGLHWDVVTRSDQPIYFSRTCDFAEWKVPENEKIHEIQSKPLKPFFS